LLFHFDGARMPKIRLQKKMPRRVAWSVIKSPAGRLIIGVSEEGEICRARFLGRRRAAEIAAEWQAEWKRTIFMAGAAPKKPFDLPVLLIGSEFQQKVWRQTMKIPLGKVMSYGDVAAHIGVPRAARAVGMACGVCPIDYIVPMHRVVGANGLGGFGLLGREVKRQMLKAEGVHYAPIRIRAAKFYGRRMDQEQIYRKFLDIYAVKRHATVF